MVFREIENLFPLKEPTEKTRMFRTLLNDQALSYFEHHLRRRLDAEDVEILDDDLKDLVLRKLYKGLEYIPKHAVQMQKYDSRQTRGLYMDLNLSLQKFLNRLNDLNHYLLNFMQEIPSS
jgi:hypothetical protein